MSPTEPDQTALDSLCHILSIVSDHFLLYIWGFAQQSQSDGYYDVQAGITYQHWHDLVYTQVRNRGLGGLDVSAS